MTKNIFAIDLGNKSAKIIRNGGKAVSIPSRYIDTLFVDGSGRLDFGAESFNKNESVKKYKMIHSASSYYFGEGIHSLGKDGHIEQSLAFGKQRYESQIFKDMLSFCICELASEFLEDIVKAELVIGFPSEDFSKENFQIIEEYAKRQHSVEINEKTINVDITKVYAIPQSIGTYYDTILNEDLTFKNEELSQQKVAVIDIGGLTKLFDIVTNFKMDTGERQQKDTGMWTLYNMIQEFLDVDSSIKPNIFEIENCVTAGIKSGGKEFIYSPNNYSGSKNTVNLTNDVVKCIDLYTKHTVNEIKTSFPHLSSIDCLIFTGGGSRVINKDIVSSSFNNMKILYSEGGQFSNVKGYLKHGLTQ